MDRIKFKIKLLFFLPLILIGGCQYRYDYKYKNLEAKAISFQTNESKIRSHCIFSVPPAPIPELMVMLDGKEIYLRQSLTKNEVLKFIKDNNIIHVFGSEGPGWRKLKTANDMDEMNVTIYAKKEGLVKLVFSKQTLVRWIVSYGEGEGLKIASPDNKEYYAMPITVLEMKEIFGNPHEVIKDINWK